MQGTNFDVNTLHVMGCTPLEARSSSDGSCLQTCLILTTAIKELIILRCIAAAQDAKRHGHQVTEALLRMNGGILSYEPGMDQIRQVLT